jgi:hypothetical protein
VAGEALVEREAAGAVGGTLAQREATWVAGGALVEREATARPGRALVLGEAGPDGGMVGLFEHDGGLGVGLGQDPLAPPLSVVGHGPAVGVSIGDVLVGGLLSLGQDADGLAVRVLVPAPRRGQAQTVRRGERVPARAGQRGHPGDPSRPRLTRPSRPGFDRRVRLRCPPGSGCGFGGGRGAQGQGRPGPGPIPGVTPGLVLGPSPTPQPVYLALERVPFPQQLVQFGFHLPAEIPHVILVETAMPQPGQAKGHRPDALRGEPGPVRQARSHGTRSP